MNKIFVMRVLRLIKNKIRIKRMMRPYILYVEKNLASGYPITREKKRTYILIQSHIVEKGLSLSDVKPWFGQPKIRDLMADVKDYYANYGDKKLLYWVVSMLQAYMEFNSKNNVAPTEIIQQYGELKTLLGDYEDESLKGGFVEATRNDFRAGSFDFARFASSRHSVRSFTGEPIDEGLIHEALKIAETTPSACNRQPWYNYVVTDKDRIDRILSIQHGARQFKDKVSALVITSSSAHFFGNDEYNQIYFNTGLYAMNLLYALHSKGLGTIPLNMGLSQEELDGIRSICGISGSQMPISLIAIGILPAKYKYARSARFDYKDYTIFL